ncbi:MAG: NAD-dependent epimerase/dehydratase family protein, partial [Bacilli bacterium]
MKSFERLSKKIFVTGVAGFIGSNLVLKLISEFDSIQIIGIDNMNDYYDVSIKEYRLSLINE